MGYMCVNGGSRECDGCGACEKEVHYYCPVCDAEVFETVYVDENKEVVGCENCVKEKEPYEVLEGEEE